MRKTLISINIVIAVACGAWLTQEFIAPAVASNVYEREYKELMFQCDHVMREHFIAKQMVLAAPSTKTARNLEASEVGLTACHGYDKLRKILLGWGVSADQLALLGLEAIESKAREVREFVNSHEIRY